MTATEIRPGLLKAFDNVNWLATVQVTGSLQIWLNSVPVARNISAAEMIVGRKVVVALYDPANGADAVVLAVHT